MSLWTDIIDPVTLTGFARKSLEDYEANTKTLADYLPNTTVDDISVRITENAPTVADAAPFRAYDAEPEIGTSAGGKRRTIDLPALSIKHVVSEYQQLRARNAGDAEMQKHILNTTNQAVRSVANSVELLRGTVLATGKATINQSNFKTDDDFGRDPSMTVTAATLWNVSGAKVLDDLRAWTDVYVGLNGEAPGSIVVSSKVFNILRQNGVFATQLLNGGSRPATDVEVNALVQSYGLPAITVYDRKVSVGGVVKTVLPDTHVLFLPAKGASNLGSTVWGTPLMAQEWGIAAGDGAGICAGVYKHDNVPAIAEVVADAIALPVLANPNLSMAAKVL